MVSEEMDPAEAMAEVDRVRRGARRVAVWPVWFAPGIVACITLIEVAYVSDDVLVYGLGSLAALLAAAGLAFVALVRHRVRKRLPVGRSFHDLVFVMAGWSGVLGVVGVVAAHAFGKVAGEVSALLLAGAVTAVLAAVTTPVVEAWVTGRKPR
ncbi:hypothetical protein GCM10027589_21350 [Actinocorallia lasiicapitis]